MTSITATEFKRNFGKYLVLAQSEPFEVTKNGKPIVNLAPVDPEPAQDFDSTQEFEPVRDFEPVGSISELFGILPKEGMTLDEAREMRLREKCGY